MAEVTRTKTYEYKTMELKQSVADAELNKLGSEGWRVLKTQFLMSKFQVVPGIFPNEKQPVQVVLEEPVWVCMLERESC